MISVPLPFVIALLLAFLLCLVLARAESGRRPVVIFLCACIALTVIVGLRWTFEAKIFRFLQPVIAALLPPAAWFCFSGLRGMARGRSWPHFLPAVAVLALSALWPRLHPPIDALLAILFFGYGALLLRRGFAGPDSLAGARLSEAPQAGKATVLAGALLLFSGFVDLAIALDFGLRDGSHAARIVAMGNMTMLPLIAWAMVVMTRSAPEAEPASQVVEVVAKEEASRGDDPATDDDRVLAEVDRLMAERKLYRDPDLTLDRLSRRLGIPARQVSGAINRKLGQNVSQAVNEWRIREAMDLLAQTDRPVTAIMFECGFQTKSNFNREFLRIAGTTPSAWRRDARSKADEPLSGAAGIASESG
ncbi:AraC-like DNA-binding protein [Pseudochelatococcus lubricantis]|uniref:AraC-like DNA-binding protein n=1 Tax=Pseudochelatococcus lubricantis TaxID=1538102 RepID=A0ABX0UZ37_9HYPH|nr:helix-turn-helix domain-containing protein [Pseudochelatococcus lubricantis]NIJ57554.1 AraC-like DNA-binding protein [Pseudochelatococcus lubricantis]